jgi:signal transduction histidine kinase
VQSALIGALVTIAVMTGLLLRRRRRRTDLLFSVLCINLVFWFLGAFLAELSRQSMWLRVELACSALLPIALIRLFAELLPGSASRGRRLLASVYPVAGVSAVLALSPLGELEFVQVSVGVAAYVTILWGSRVMMQATELGRGTVDYARRRYLSIGAVATATLCGVSQLSFLRENWASIGYLAVMIYVFFLAQVILRERLLDLNELLGRMGVLGIIAVLFAGISAFMIGIGENASSKLFNAVIGVSILLTLYEPLKERLEQKLSEVFFRERYRFTQTIDALRTRMQHGVLDPGRMSQILVDSLYDSRRATHVAVYLLEPGSQGFVRRAYRGPEPVLRVSPQELPGLYKVIHERSQLSADDLDPQSDTDAELLQALRAVSADALFPFASGEQVLGFLALRDDRSPEPYSTDELRRLAILAETAATVVWNSKLSEQVRERERLALVGAMAAGLAHEIRNPLGAIKGAAEYLDPERFPDDDEGEFLQVIIEETNRLNSVVSQFLDYARPFRACFETTDVNDVVRRTAKLVDAATAGEAVVQLDLDRDLPPISADREQIKQVLLNLIRNAVEASTGSDRPVEVRTRGLPARRSVEIRVRDHGTGIPTRDMEQIFIPFFTTKQTGTGMGLAVCQRIVLNHGGTITPSSQVGRGTEFIVELPVRRSEATGAEPIAKSAAVAG